VRAADSATDTEGAESMTDKSAAFDLLAAKLEYWRRQHQDDLNRALFAAGPPVYVAPIARWTRLTWRVRAYITTLWHAIKGEDPYDVEHDY
jgi:hypothetical protein